MKNKILNNGVEIVSMAEGWTGGAARVRLRAPLSGSDIRPDAGLIERLKKAGVVSQWSLMPGQIKQDNFNFQDVNDVIPQDGDYISVPFRALSKVVVPGHWLDWTKDNVLEESVGLLPGATVYPNHDFSDINNWLGSVSAAAWDAEGTAAGGVPGINVQYKIDALMNPRIARGLLMKPPAIHSTSMTVLFEFEYSHLDLALESKWKFFELLGEEVDGHIVRLIVTKIAEYWEASLVFQGADRLAKQYPDDVSGEQLAASGAELGEVEEKEKEEEADRSVRAPSNEEKTMKLTAEQKKSLGIEFDGEDVPETDILKAAESMAAKATAAEAALPKDLAELQSKAADGAKFVELQRTEVVRLAKLAELGAETGELAAVIDEDIKAASFDRLVQLGTFYQEKVTKRFPKGGRSSLEDGDAVETAGGLKKAEKKLPKVGVH